MSTQKAIVLDGSYASLVTDRPLPKLRPGYVAVKTKAVAINPTDYKSIQRSNVAGALGGCDHAGVVEQIGEGYEKKWKVGDRIAGFAFGNNFRHHDDGAFAEHIIVRADTALRIPESMSFEEAATLGVGSATVGQGLFSRQGLRLDTPDNPNQQGENLFIYGGSTATAAMGIQLATLAGYKVYTVCSPEHFDFVKSRGAVAVFDYKDPTSIDHLRSASQGGFKYVWDTITLPMSAAYCEQLLLPNGLYRSLSPVPISRTDIDVAWTLAYTALGEPVEKRPVLVKLDVSEDYEDGKEFVAMFQKLLLAGKVQTHPYTASSEGLYGILEGLKLLNEGQVRGQKLVYTIDHSR